MSFYSCAQNPAREGVTPAPNVKAALRCRARAGLRAAGLLEGARNAEAIAPVVVCQPDAKQAFSLPLPAQDIV